MDVLEFLETEPCYLLAYWAKNKVTALDSLLMLKEQYIEAYPNHVSSLEITEYSVSNMVKSSISSMKADDDMALSTNLGGDSLTSSYARPDHDPCFWSWCRQFNGEVDETFSELLRRDPAMIQAMYAIMSSKLGLYVIDPR